MNRYSRLALAGCSLFVGLGISSCSPKIRKDATPPLQLVTLQDSVAYALGVYSADAVRGNLRQITSDSLSWNREMIVHGFGDLLSGQKVEINPEQALQILQKEAQRLQKVEEELFRSQNDSALLLNKQKEEVQITESGLQYRILNKGQGGATPSLQDTVVVHYRGRTIDDVEFDSSYKRGEPAELLLVDVIPGWQEGLSLMSIGDKYELCIPASLAYGTRGAGRAIRPHATLFFEIELLGIKPRKDTTQTDTK